MQLLLFALHSAGSFTKIFVFYSLCSPQRVQDSCNLWHGIWLCFGFVQNRLIENFFNESEYCSIWSGIFYHRFNKITSLLLWLMYTGGDPSARAVNGLDLRPFACWGCEFKFRPGHGCLSLVSVGLITRPEESYRVSCVWVWSRSHDNKEALVHLGLLRHGKNLHRKASFMQPIFVYVQRTFKPRKKYPLVRGANPFTVW
jgi:hypothetical protein